MEPRKYKETKMKTNKQSNNKRKKNEQQEQQKKQERTDASMVAMACSGLSVHRDEGGVEKRKRNLTIHTRLFRID